MVRRVTALFAAMVTSACAAAAANAAPHDGYWTGRDTCES
jgi:hypothetical protein